MKNTNRPKVAQAMLRCAEILNAEIENDYRLLLRIHKNYVEGVWPRSERASITITSKQVGESNKYEIAVEVSWPTTTYDPIKAMIAGELHHRVATLAMRCHYIVCGWQWTKKDVESAHREIELIQELEEVDDR